MSRSVRLAVGGLAAAATLAVAAAPAAHAQHVALEGGATTLRLAPGAAGALEDLGVSVAPTGRARAGRAGIAFPITGGRIAPATAVGQVTHTGGLRLRGGGRSVTLSSFTVDTRRGFVSARVGGTSQRLRAFRLGLGNARVTRQGLGTTASGVQVTLSPAGARALNRTFRVTAFTRGLRIATATVRAEPAEALFRGGATSLAVDPGALAALQQLGITPGLAEPASANPDGTFAFPIIGGRANLETLAGTISHSGGITLTRDATVVTLADFVIDTRAAQLTATINGGDRAAILALDLANPQVAVSGRTITVSGVGATLTQGAADALNAAFGTTAFTAGLRLGAATVAGQAR